MTLVVPKASTHLLGRGGQNCMDLKWDNRLFPASIPLPVRKRSRVLVGRLIDQTFGVNASAGRSWCWPRMSLCVARPWPQAVSEIHPPLSCLLHCWCSLTLATLPTTSCSFSSLLECVDSSLLFLHFCLAHSCVRKVPCCTDPVMLKPSCDSPEACCPW